MFLDDDQQESKTNLWEKIEINGSTAYITANRKIEYLPINEYSLGKLNNKETCDNYSMHYSGKHIVKYDRNYGIPLPSGFYRLLYTDRDGYYLLSRSQVPEVRLFELGVVKEVIQDVENFRNNKDNYEKLGLSYKRGCLLYGPPGTGKTSAINMVIDKVMDDECLVFYVKDKIPDNILDKLRQEKRFKIVIFEELTETIKSVGMGEFLLLLDGETSLTNCYIMATTNYPEALPGNIVSRPGRFDRLILVDQITESEKVIYLKHFLNRELTQEELVKIKPFSMAFLRELVVQMTINKVSFDEAIKQLEEHRTIASTKFAAPEKDDDLYKNIL